MVTVRLQEESWSRFGFSLGTLLSTGSRLPSIYRYSPRESFSREVAQQRLASRKKARGKAGKARKKAKVDDAGVVVSNAPVARVVSSIHVHRGNDEHEDEAEAALGPLLSLSQLRLRKPNNASSFSTSLKCTHGWNPFECAHGHDCRKFIEAAWGVFQFQARVRVR
eukprot:scaffold1151_cov144-Skeletonema_menzelii.AAC.6